MRFALLPANRVSPFALVGAGGGVSRPTVNAYFPTASETIFAFCMWVVVFAFRWAAGSACQAMRVACSG